MGGFSSSPLPPPQSADSHKTDSSIHTDSNNPQSSSVMPSSSDPKIPDSKTRKEPADSSTVTKTHEETNPSREVIEGEEGKGEEEGGEEEEGECGFCLFMKGGGCKDAFTAWEDCIKEAEENGNDIVEKCFDVTSKLKTCMEAHADYYEPILRAEKVAGEEAVKELEKEKEKEKEKVASAESKETENSGAN